MDLPTASWDQTYIISAHLCKCQVIEIGWIFNMVSLRLSSVLLGQNWGTAFSLLFSSFLSINVSSCPESVIGRWLWLECKAALLLLLMSAPNQGSEWETIWNILREMLHSCGPGWWLELLHWFYLRLDWRADQTLLLKRGYDMQKGEAPFRQTVHQGENFWGQNQGRKTGLIPDFCCFYYLLFIVEFPLMFFLIFN